MRFATITQATDFRGIRGRLSRSINTLTATTRALRTVYDDLPLAGIKDINEVNGELLKIMDAITMAASKLTDLKVSMQEDY